jgi:hypothetical protein
MWLGGDCGHAGLLFSIFLKEITGLTHEADSFLIVPDEESNGEHGFYDGQCYTILA